VRTLGNGSFSAVVLCQHHSGEIFAAKVVARSFLNERHLFDRFEREVRVLESLAHPNIVELVNIVYTEEIIYLIMEYCQSGDLGDFLVCHPYPTAPLLARIFKGICEGLAFIRSHDIAHRDIKPENILLDGDLVPHLADFGLCNTRASRNLMTTLCGSPGYIAPEILAQTPYDGKSVDIWSLGMVLQVMFTGHTPWGTSSAVGTFTKRRKSDFEIPDHLPAAIRELIVRMRMNDPQLRPTIGQILKSSLLVNVVVSLPTELGLPRLERRSSDLQKKPLGPTFKKLEKGGLVTPRNMALPRPIKLTTLVRKVPAKMALRSSTPPPSIGLKAIPILV
jgi:serine/threonine protein kinase